MRFNRPTTCRAVSPYFNSRIVGKILLSKTRISVSYAREPIEGNRSRKAQFTPTQ
jgi:hypothetical protein